MSEPVSIENALREATEQLRAVSDSARLDAELLLCRAIDMPRAYLFAHPEEELDEASLDRFDQTVARRLAGEPMAYIEGVKEFWSMELMVSPATLVPRPETEVLVDRALCEIPRDAAWNILDLGTGSGAVALAIARERPLCNVTATDVSEDALAVARVNAQQLNLGNVEFLQGGWTDPVRDRTFDVIVSNPPYVATGDSSLDKLQCEPQSALVAGEDGLDAIRVLVKDCRDILKPGGVFAFEHGSAQAANVEALCLRYAWIDIHCHKDYALLPRVTVARKPDEGKS